jgi:hypothetical protein
MKAISPPQRVAATQTFVSFLKNLRVETSFSRSMEFSRALLYKTAPL